MTEEIALEPEPTREEGDITTILYQEQMEEPAEHFYTETIVTDSGLAAPSLEEVKQPPVRIKNKRTVAAVSSEDKRLALNAMEELRSRGATTDDLICRLCSPARPFTAYSTLLTHYRSHAGLRPFECSLCGATFTRQHSLNYHLMTHANQTRFTCPHCNRKFRHPTHFKVSASLPLTESHYYHVHFRSTSRNTEKSSNSSVSSALPPCPPRANTGNT